MPLQISTVKRKKDRQAALEADVRQLSEAAHGKSPAERRAMFDSIGLPDPASFIQALNKMLGKKPSYDHSRLVRHITSILHDYKDELPYEAAEQTALLQGLGGLVSQIGTTPTLLAEPELPDPEFLPDDFDDLIAHWQTMTCSTVPKRGSGPAEVHFVKLGRKTSSRDHMAHQASLDKINILTLPSGEQLFLNLTDLAYYTLTLMHADHMAPSTELIERQQEIIEAMNLNPAFRKTMEEQYGATGFFLPDPANPEKVVGSFWFFMALHHDTSNLWFLLASENMFKGAKITNLA